VQQKTGVLRRAEDVDPGLLEAVFKLAHPSKAGDTKALVPMEKGHYALVVLNSVEPGDASKIPEEAQQFLREQMARAYGNADIQEFLDVLRSQSKIEVAKQRL
jgi:peptidyl-prolyl cis-trans isomerase D